MGLEPETAGDLQSHVFPHGWFQVGWSGELKRGDVVPLRYFDKDLVLFRTNQGVATVLDAHCRHLGAHLGYGGRVEDECIVCPFHEWKWAADGRHVATPYSERQTQRARIRAWPTVETAGLICVWYDPDGGRPQWEAPSIPEATDDSFQSPWPLATKKWSSVATQPQYVTENMVDVSHLKSVHRAANPGTLTSISENGPRVHVVLTLGIGEGKKATALTPEGPLKTILEATGEGMGFTVFKFVDLSPTRYVTSVTPVDHKLSDVRVSLFLPKDRGTNGDELSPWGKATLAEIVKQNERDFHIFRTLQYVEHPPFTPEERKSYPLLRKWTQQFYRRQTLASAESIEA
jgi:3-ketosteroid 9alpha-monooxygenase subunit A